MVLKLEARPEPSRAMQLASPVLAVIATMVTGAVIFTLLGFDGIGGVKEIFITPLINTLKWQEILVKAAPLILIATGLSIGFRANVWNIGAEGQYIAGGLGGTGIALLTWEMEGWWILPLMGIAGVVGGMLYALIPALLKTRLKVSEILTSLMMTYIAIQLLYYLMNGPWKDPTGFGFPQTRLFTEWQTLPYVVSGTVIHLGVPIVFVLAIVFWVIMTKSLFGFQVRSAGEAPRATIYGGFSVEGTVIKSLLIGGGLAGLAGMLEAAGPFGQMVPQFPTGYGFTAIIVAFLGRLNPLGVIFAGLLLAVTYVGGEIAQTTIGLPNAVAGIFQAMTLFFLLAVEVLVRYRIVFKGLPGWMGAKS